MKPLTLTHIIRHPIKSVGWQELDACSLTKEQALPFDRHWAIATEGAPFDGNPDEWHPKMRFVRGAAGGSLQAVRADFDDASKTISLSHPDLPDFKGKLPDDGPNLVNWLTPLWPSTRPASSHLVQRTDGGALTDSKPPYVSILSLTSLRILSKRMGLDLSKHRFRGNLWLDGLAPWEEFDLIGKDIQIGQARLHVEERIERCVATTFDPETGRPLGDPLTALETAWDHRDFGVFARVIQSGDIRVGDEVKVLP